MLRGMELLRGMGRMSRVECKGGWGMERWIDNG
jgi:hypothetical protein